MEELGIPDEFRAAVHKLYEQVRAKIITREGMSECFGSNIGVKQGCPLSPTLFGLYIDKLEDWLNKTEGGGIQLASYVVKLLLYADDLILISKTAQGLREQLKALELFCQEVGMQVNTSKTKIMIFTLKRNERQNVFLFEGSPLEIVNEYKYLGIDFHHKLSWETCKAKRIQGGWKASFLLQNRCRKAELWDWKTKKTLFGLLVTPVVLYGCEVWGSSMSNHGWRQIERIQKHLITSSLKVKSTVPYEILLAEAGSFSLEASAIARMISYLKKVENMDNLRWPKMVVNDTLERKKKTWMNQNTKWMYKWGINMQECPNSNREIKNYVIERFRTAMWTGQIGRKKAHYIREFNLTGEHDEKAYLGTVIKGKAKILVAQLRTGSHHLRCETGRWTIPKEDWERRICLFCSKGVVETEWHFVMECSAYDDIRIQYKNNLKVDRLEELFEGTKLPATTSFIFKIHSRRADIEKSLKSD
ncbi:hypothetical protein KI387_043788 [Taxus chinensis]|uniref:Reverse transcriptase domain-containing protein n=1 Tax=Taxus chinensis TaxID=29808 RepID=A0AA38KM33_TAXCH|nr:hypothetical protein KI387_043788 [Taxus chinensis]